MVSVFHILVSVLVLLIAHNEVGVPQLSFHQDDGQNVKFKLI